MKVALVVLVLVLWVLLTSAAIAVTPDRGEDPPDLSVDEKWLLRTPPNPVQYDRAPSVRIAVATTTTRFTTPGPTARAAAPRPPPTRPNTAGVEQWRTLLAQYPWPVDLMLRVVKCESGGDPTNYNGRSRGIPWSPSRASGLFQLYPAPPGWEDPVTNTRLAYAKYVAGGLLPWSSSRSCWG